MIIIIRCAVCKKKIFEYYKAGHGKLHRCWKKRILVDNAVYDGELVKCKCGNIIGYDRGGFIKLIDGSYKISGRKR
ncbi:MAG: hypothetical protein ACP6IP_02855 [Candidatus Njordarchaeia archaeon]